MSRQMLTPCGTVEKAKAMAYNTCMLQQATYCSCSGDVIVTDRDGVQPIGRRLSLRPQTNPRPTSHTEPWSVVKWCPPPKIRVTAWITTLLPTPNGQKAEFAWLADP